MQEQNEKIVIFWFRRDLRLDDNRGLWHALSSGYRVMPLFIFDSQIINALGKSDPRVEFIQQAIDLINLELREVNSTIHTYFGTPQRVFMELSGKYSIKSVYFNEDYEPYGIERDRGLKVFLKSKGIEVHNYTDHVIFGMKQIVKDDGSPYTVYTPYSNRWRRELTGEHFQKYPSGSLLMKFLQNVPVQKITAKKLGFKTTGIKVKNWDIGKSKIISYHLRRDFPGEEGTTNLGPHLRFGTISIREVIRQTLDINPVFTGELIWREFFMQILYHFPHVEDKSFRPEYDKIAWSNDDKLFSRWCDGNTGYPLVDAGMRELMLTGYMHNRVRMVTASFLTKHLLTDWRLGEAWFASKLLDYELSSNNGNWQWAAGSGCDAAPWFRIFNPELQLKKFDPELKYITKWIPEYGTPDYPVPVVKHREAREKALLWYRSGING